MKRDLDDASLAEVVARANALRVTADRMDELVAEVRALREGQRRFRAAARIADEGVMAHRRGCEACRKLHECDDGARLRRVMEAVK